MNSPTAAVLENLQLYGREALRSSFSVYWASITTTYGLRRARRLGSRASRPKKQVKTSDYLNIG